jgi:hypothetical protein
LHPLYECPSSPRQKDLKFSAIIGDIVIEKDLYDQIMELRGYSNL